MGDGVEERGGRHPARFPRVLGDHARKRGALLRGGPGKRVVEHTRISSGHIPAGEQGIDVRQRAAVEGRARHVVGGEAGGDIAYGRQQGGERPAVALRREPGRAVRLQAGEADRAAHRVRHAAALAVIAEPGDTVVLVVVDLDIWIVARLNGAPVGRVHAGLGDQGAGDRRAPERLAGARHDRPALRQRLLGERFPDGVGEVAAEMRQSHHRVLRPVEPARQRRHQGDGRDDAHDRPGAKAEAALPRGIDGAGGGVPDQQEARQHQNAGIEGEQHVADGRGIVRPKPAQEGQHFAGRAVGVGEEAAIDGLRGGRIGRGDRGQTEACE